MFWMLVAEVIVPLVIDQAYVVAPAGPLAVLPTEFGQTLAGVGVMVGVAGALTVSVAAVVVELPQELVKTARYWLPLSDAAVVKVSEVDVAPAMLLKVPPPLVETCHCTVAAGVAVAAAVKVTGCPAQMVCEAGLVVTAGGTLTVSVAAVVCAVPSGLVKTARYCLPLSAAVAVKV